MKKRKPVALLAAILLFFACQSDQPIPQSGNFDLVPLAEGVYACIHKFGGKAICNIGIVDTGEETLIFDTFISPVVAKEIPVLVKKLGLSPIRYVVNSHWHNDHIRGNQVFSDEVELISTQKTAELIQQNEPIEIADEKEYAPVQFAYYDSLLQNYEGDTLDREYQRLLMWQPYFYAMMESHPILETRVPDSFVEDVRSISGSDRELRLVAMGSAHTESDLVLYLPDDKILFSGDLVFAGMHPYMAHGHLGGLKESLFTLQQLEIEQVVPGHGPVSKKHALADMSSYIESLESVASGFLQDSMTMEEASAMEIPEPFQDWWFDRFFARNLKFTFEALSD